MLRFCILTFIAILLQLLKNYVAAIKTSCVHTFLSRIGIEEMIRIHFISSALQFAGNPEITLPSQSLFNRRKRRSAYIRTSGPKH